MSSLCCEWPWKWKGSAESPPRRHRTAGRDRWPAGDGNTALTNNNNNSNKQRKSHPPHPHTLSIPHCTRSERGTVGHSCCHCRLNAATAAPMKITPRTKKNCMEGKHRLYSALTLVKKSKQTKTNQMVKAGATLCTQCRLGGSRRATWIRPKSCKKWCSQ